MRQSKISDKTAEEGQEAPLLPQEGKNYITLLNQRLDSAVVVDSAARGATDQIFFGTTVSYVDGDGKAHTIAIEVRYEALV